MSFISQSNKQIKGMVRLDPQFISHHMLLTFFLISHSSHTPLIPPSPLMQHATKTLHGRICPGRMSHFVVACRTSQVCEQCKKIYLQQKCRSRKSHVCEHWLRRNLCPGNLSPYYLTKPSHNHTDVTLFRGI